MHPFQPGYPRTYQMSRNALWFNNGFAIFLPGFFVMTILHAIGFMRHPLPLKTMVWMDLSAPPLFALLISPRANRKVILYQDAIEVRGWFSTRKLRRDEILGRRMGRISAPGGGGSYYIIVPADESAGELGPPPHMTVGKVFSSWMSDIPKVAK
jgi:hypothetical protein